MDLILNGSACSYSSIKLDSGTDSINGITSVSFSTSIERGEIRGTGRQKLARTRGPVSFEGSITWIIEEFIRFKNSKNGGVGYMDIPFDLHLTVEEVDEHLSTVDLISCVFDGDESDFQQGPDGLTITTPINIMIIKRDGKHVALGMTG